MSREVVLYFVLLLGAGSVYIPTDTDRMIHTDPTVYTSMNTIILASAVCVMVTLMVVTIRSDSCLNVRDSPIVARKEKAHAHVRSMPTASRYHVFANLYLFVLIAISMCRCVSADLATVSVGSTSEGFAEFTINDF